MGFLKSSIFFIGGMFVGWVIGSQGRKYKMVNFSRYNTLQKTNERLFIFGQGDWDDKNLQQFWEEHFFIIKKNQKDDKGLSVEKDDKGITIKKD